jgi:hypothetical protein
VEWSEETPTFELVKSMVTVPEVLELLGIEVTGGNKFRLREEDRTPSVHAYEEHYYDYSTGIGGDVVDLVVAVTGMPVGKALWTIWNRGLRAGMEPGDVERTEVRSVENFYDSIPWQNARDHHYDALGRRLTPAGCDYDWLTSQQYVVPSEDGLLVPHWDLSLFGEDGKLRVHGVKIRRHDGAKQAWTGSQFTHRLYELCWTHQLPVTECWLVEGESDSWALHGHFRSLDNCDVPPIFALPSGAATWRDTWLEQLASYETVYVCTDNDVAGKSARDKLHSKIGWGRVKDVLIPDLLNDLREALVAGWQPPV